MKFEEAMKEMNEGHSVMNDQCKDTVYKNVDGLICCKLNGNWEPIASYFGGWFWTADWNVVEEPKKTLSDKISMMGNPHLFVRDVKPALKEFILFCDDRVGFSGTSIVRDKAEKIFGERLLE